MLEKIKNFIFKYIIIDYDIVGEFYETRDNGHVYKKYIKKYKIKRR